MVTSNNQDSLLAGANESLQHNLNAGKPEIFAAYAMAGSIIFFGGGGYLLDRWLRTPPWFLLVGLLIGVCFGFYRLIDAARRHQAESGAR